MAQTTLGCLLILSMAATVLGNVPTYLGCSEDIEGVSDGSINYNGDGQRYPNQTKCTWKITVDDGQRLSVRFERLKLKDGDNLIIKDGEGGTIVSFDNKTLPNPFSTNGDKMYIHLSSDTNFTNTGFKLTWRIFNQDMENKKTSSSKEFVIKHKISGKYVTIMEPVIFRRYKFSSYINDTNIMTFEIHDGKWGYIKHKHYNLQLSYIFVPVSESVGLYSTHAHPTNPLALFALNQVNNHIISRIGQIMQPALDGAEKIIPPDGSQVYMGPPPTNDKPEWSIASMEFILVDPENPSEEVFPYGKPTIIGDWNVVFSVMNPKAEHSYSITTKVGHVETAGSTSNSFKYKWEFTGASGGFSFKKGFSASVTGDQKLQTEIQQSSSDTWNTETDVNIEFKVEAGKSVTIWQRHYIGEQFDHVGVFQSNMFADTESIHEQPSDETPHRFISETYRPNRSPKSLVQMVDVSINI